MKSVYFLMKRSLYYSWWKGPCIASGETDEEAWCSYWGKDHFVQPYEGVIVQILMKSSWYSCWLIDPCIAPDEGVLVQFLMMGSWYRISWWGPYTAPGEGILVQVLMTCTVPDEGVLCSWGSLYSSWKRSLFIVSDEGVLVQILMRRSLYNSWRRPI